MRPFRTLWNNYPVVDHDALFTAMGWAQEKDNPNFANTCAIRISYCLGLSGVKISSRQGMLTTWFWELPR